MLQRWFLNFCLLETLSWRRSLSSLFLFFVFILGLHTWPNKRLVFLLCIFFPSFFWHEIDQNWSQKKEIFISPTVNDGDSDSSIFQGFSTSSSVLLLPPGKGIWARHFGAKMSRHTIKLCGGAVPLVGNPCCLCFRCTAHSRWWTLEKRSCAIRTGNARQETERHWCRSTGEHPCML